MAPGTVVVLCIIGLLLVVSAAMSASEVALFALSPSQLREVQERGGNSGRRVLDLLAKPRRLLATILIASNLVNMGVVILSAVIAHDLLDLGGLPAYLVVFIQVLVIAFVIVSLARCCPRCMPPPTRCGSPRR